MNSLPLQSILPLFKSKVQRRVVRRRRRLGLESLERRMLLAGNVMELPDAAFDINDDGALSPVDGLLLINRISREGGAKRLGPAESRLDTSGNGVLSEVDVLLVLNRLENSSSRAQGKARGNNGVPARISALHARIDELMAKDAELMAMDDFLQDQIDNIELTPGPQGEIGPIGPQGPAGADGADGAQGPAGLQGPVGADGAQGPVGPAGANGLVGADGATGPQGPQGLVGPAGADGAPGADGADGAVGATGAQGDQGVAGATGLDGADGATGAQGPQGVAGPEGPQGPSGADGVNGADGATGAQGLQGVVGPEGADGADGTDGVTGAQGPQGATGPAGPQGATGPAGPAGVSVETLDFSNSFPGNPSPQSVIYTSRGNQGPPASASPSGFIAHSNSKVVGPANNDGLGSSTRNYNGISALDGTYMDVQSINPQYLFALENDELPSNDVRQIDLTAYVSMGSVAPVFTVVNFAIWNNVTSQWETITTKTLNTVPSGFVWRQVNATVQVIDGSPYANSQERVHVHAYSTDPNVSFSIDYFQLRLSASVDGADGATGAQGPQGVPGPAGPQGATGPQGPQGDTAVITAGAGLTKTGDQLDVGGSTTIISNADNLEVNSSGTINQILLSSGSTGTAATFGSLPLGDSNAVGGTLSVTNGGTGATTLTSGNFLQGNGTSAITATKTVPSGNVVGTSDVQTLTNKTIDTATNTFTLATADVTSGKFADARIAESNVTQHEFAITLANLVGAPSGPVVGITDTQTLFNKTIDADMNTLSNIDNADIKAGAAIDATKIANGSVSNSELQQLDGVTSAVVGVSNTQTLTNKTLTDSSTYLQDNADNTKKLQLQLSGITTATTRTLTVPDADTTITGTTNTQTLTNKTIDADNNTLVNIDNADIKAGAAIDATKIAEGSVTDTEFQYLNGLTSAVVGISDTQTLTNKTIDTATNTFTLATADVTSGTFADARIAESNVTQHEAAITLANLVGAPSGPVVGTSDTQTLTNKTIDADNNTLVNIDNADIKAGAAIDATKIADGSVSNSELQQLDGVTSGVQAQIDALVARIADLEALVASYHP